MKEYKRKIEKALIDLNITLREQLIDTKLVTIQQWNEEIAPKMMNMLLFIEEEQVTARTFGLPESYFD